MFGYPDRSADALLAGGLPLRYCSARFACKLPTWRLPDRGCVGYLVAEYVVDAGVGGELFPPPVIVVLVVLLMFRFWGALKEFDSTEKHPHTLQEWGFAWILNLVLGFGRDCEFLGFIGVQFVILM